MQELNSFSSNAKVGCPFFKKQESTAICCSALFPMQKTTWLKFATIEGKEQHLHNFCFDLCYKGCPLAAAINENELLEETEKRK